MRHDHLPKGSERDPFSLFDLLSAVRVAKKYERKIWARLRGDNAHLYEVWPGGRSVAWPIAVLENRWERQAPLPAGHKCRHVWDTHTDSDPVAAGLHITSWRQCLKCGQVREDWPQKRQRKLSEEGCMNEHCLQHETHHPDCKACNSPRAPEPSAAPEATRCKDCDDAARHAYSDATTAGFFYSKCAKHRITPSAATKERLFTNTQPPPKDKETTRFPAVEPSVEQRARELWREIRLGTSPEDGGVWAAGESLAKRAILAEDKLEAERKEVDRLTRGGCGLPGHTTVTADEGTCYCLTCEMISQRDALKAELSKLKQEIKNAS